MPSDRNPVLSSLIKAKSFLIHSPNLWLRAAAAQFIQGELVVGEQAAAEPEKEIALNTWFGGGQLFGWLWSPAAMFVVLLRNRITGNVSSLFFLAACLQSQRGNRHRTDVNERFDKWFIWLASLLNRCVLLGSRYSKWLKQISSLVSHQLLKALC